MLLVLPELHSKEGRGEVLSHLRNLQGMQSYGTQTRIGGKPPHRVRGVAQELPALLLELRFLPDLLSEGSLLLAGPGEPNHLHLLGDLGTPSARPQELSRG